MLNHNSSCVGAQYSPHPRLRHAPPPAHTASAHILFRGISRRVRWRNELPASLQTQAPAAADPLPAELRQQTATLRAEGPGGPVTVHVLGVSHVSKESVRHVEQLVELCKPDVVLVELCKDRVGLLLGSTPPRLWHARATRLTGVPRAAGWPAAEQLAARLKCAGMDPVGVADIEDDVISLLSTGLFSRVTPAARPGPDTLAPGFVQQGGRLQLVAPLGEVELAAVPRALPQLSSLAVEMDAELGSAVVEAVQGAADRAEEQALHRSAGGAPVVDCLLQMRQALLGSLSRDQRQHTEVVFSLNDPKPGAVRAVVQPVPPGRQPSATGLEAPGGVGPGIETFRRQAPAPRPAAQQASLGSSPSVDLGGLPVFGGGSAAAVPPTPPQRQAATADWRPWTEEQRRADDAASSSTAGSGGAAPGLAGALASALTQAYAAFQADAGRTVGVAPGAAWQAAVRAAAKHGARQVLLGDRPAGVTAVRLAQAIWSSSSVFLLGSVPAAAASAVIVAAALGGDAGPAGAAAPLAAAALPLAAAAWPVVAPLVEVWRLSRLSAREIEDAVRVKERLQSDDPRAPLVKLWGEDALLGWPGAMAPVIDERDEFMARALAAAALGRPEGLTPALVATAPAAGSDVVWRYCMPAGGAESVCPSGRGDGAYAPAASVRVVVGVVGTAHVRGIARRWQEAQRDVRLDQLAR